MVEKLSNLPSPSANHSRYLATMASALRMCAHNAVQLAHHTWQGRGCRLYMQHPHRAGHAATHQCFATPAKMAAVTP